MAASDAESPEATGHARLVVAVWLAATVTALWSLNPVTLADILPLCTTAR